jgi:integrase
LAKTLTAAAVKNYRPGKGRREIPDGGCPGLYLVIQASGRRSWAMRFRRPNGKPAKLTLGPVDMSGKEAESEPVLDSPLTLASVRRLAAEIHRQRAMGRDVVADCDASRRRQKSEHESRAKSTFAAAASDFIEQYASKKTRRWRETARLLGLAYPPTGGEPTPIRGGLCERWSDKPIAEIDGHDIHSLIDETRRSGAPGLERRSAGPTDARARVMLSCLSKMFGWLVQHRMVSQNPCKDVHRPEASRARDRVLTHAEIVKFWRATAVEREEFSALLKLLLLTGCRLNEVARMTRAELSDDGATWNIPAARTKNHRLHMVPLSPAARELIARVAQEGQLVFTTNGRSPVSGWSKIKQRLDRAMKIPPWRLHDLRRTAVTGMAELGIRPDVIERAVNHVSGTRGGIAGVYNRSELLPERRAALERWALHVEGIVTGHAAKVVPLRVGREP